MTQEPGTKSVAKMAEEKVAVPRTSVPGERVFSAAGDIVSSSRSVLSPENVDMLMFLEKQN